jgi:tetratricopeptide (TPR) repeat protein
LALVAVQYAISTNRQSIEIAAERDKANAVSDFLVGLFEDTNANVLRGDTRVDARELVDQGVARLASDSTLLPETRASILESVGRVYGGLSAWPEAEKIAQQELVLRRSLHGDQSAEVATVLEQLSALQDLTGDWSAAERSATQAMEIRARLDDALGIASSRLRIGRMRHLRGDHSAARPHYEAALAIFERDLGAEDRRTLDAMGALAALSMHEGKLDVAEQMQLDLIAVRSQLYGEHSVAVMENWLGLGQVFIQQKRFDEAKDALERAASINFQSGGEDLNSNAFVFNALGFVEIERGEYSRALAVLTDALALWDGLRENHPNSGYAHESLGRTHMLLGNAADAAKCFARSIEVFEIAGQGFPRLDVVRVRRAEALIELDDTAGARSLVSLALPSLIASRGEDHADTKFAQSVAQRLSTLESEPRSTRLDQ